ncbi:hypothetical protein HYT56_05375 [Candidatus Woesearchaeota archaeon]|nr:hypothetical protein [Candidatus Woesearchaeota archaeon]
MNKIYLTFSILLFVIPLVSAQSFIDVNIDKLFLADEDIDFFVKLNNPDSEIFEGRLFVELISRERNIKLAEEAFFIYPKDSNIKIFNEKLGAGNYKLRVEIKDRFFEKIWDQKIVEFNVVGSCNEQICLLEEADRKCDCSRNSGNKFNMSLVVLFTTIIIGIVTALYFEVKRRKPLT